MPVEVMVGDGYAQFLQTGCHAGGGAAAVKRIEPVCGQIAQRASQFGLHQHMTFGEGEAIVEEERRAHTRIGPQTFTVDLDGLRESGADRNTLFGQFDRRHQHRRRGQGATGIEERGPTRDRARHRHRQRAADRHRRRRLEQFNDRRSGSSASGV